MPAPKLVLHPDAEADPPSCASLLALLDELGVIGPSFALDGRTHYRTGPGFLDHLSFVGCAPAIEVDPPAAEVEAAARAGRFCHVHVTAATALPRVRCHPDRSPRCRHCRKEFPPTALMQTLPLHCPGCGRPSRAGALNWRQSGGCARLFVEVWGIHTGEAVPGEQLLERLGPDWTFFYIED